MIKPRKTKARVIVETRTVAGTYYQSELVKCGKPRCKRCKRRAAHGPYWYSYRWSKRLKRLVSKYRGKAAPEGRVSL